MPGLFSKMFNGLSSCAWLVLGCKVLFTILVGIAVVLAFTGVAGAASAFGLKTKYPA